MPKSRGIGSIYKLPNGHYAGSLSLGYRLDDSGRTVRNRPVVYGDTAAEVQTKLRDLLSRHQAGEAVYGPDQTVSRFLQGWLSTVKAPSVSAASLANYTNIVAKRIEPAIGPVPLRKLTPQHVQRMVATHSTRYARSTVINTLTLLRDALDVAVEWGLLARNPASAARIPKGPDKRRPLKYWTRDQANRFLEASHDHRLSVLFDMMLSVGLRSGEARAIQWRDLDLARGSLSVRRSMTREKGKPVLGALKTAASRRELPLPPRLVARLREHRERQYQEQQFFRFPGTDLVFTTMMGRPLRDTVVLWQFKTLCKAARVPYITVHGLRHTCATLLLEAGVSVNAVAELLGHSDIHITLQTYGHVTPGLKQSTADTMQSLLG